MNSSEYFIHYVWQHRLFKSEPLKSRCGQDIEIIDTGIINSNSGPDFFNAKIKIGNRLWAGNVEIHKKSDDWYRHKHHSDSAYNSVILHVVAQSTGKEIKNSLGIRIPELEITIPTNVKQNYDYLLHPGTKYPCSPYLETFPKIYLSSWINTLLVERLEKKVERIYELLSLYKNSWDDVMYILFFRNMGFGLNADYFERVAKSLPYIYLQKNRSTPIAVEALIFGQAGLLDDSEIYDSYYEKIKEEYSFLKNKYTLKNPHTKTLKSHRVRPKGFPEIRLAQTASVLYNEESIFSKVIEIKEFEKLRLLFHHPVSEYWREHLHFGNKSKYSNNFIGEKSLNLIIINSVIPMLFAYGHKIGNKEYSDRALDILEKIPPEDNTIISRFRKGNVICKNAFDSQALIQLSNEYCDKRKCVFCKIGYRILTDKAK